MNRHLPLAVAFSSLLGAQSPVTLNAVERQWPPAMPGVDTDLACGAFVSGHPARGVAVVRDGQLRLLSEPANYEHFLATGVAGIGAIATLPSVDAGPDLLAALTPTGLRVLRYGAGTFADALADQTLLPAWAGARDLTTSVWPVPGLPPRYLLGHAPQ